SNIPYLTPLLQSHSLLSCPPMPGSIQTSNGRTNERCQALPCGPSCADLRHDRIRQVTCDFGRQNVHVIAVRLWFLRCPDLRQYVLSTVWRKARQPIAAAKPRQCFGCGSLDQLSLHHTNYERLGHERLDDAEWLCPSCHARAHENVQLKQD